MKKNDAIQSENTGNYQIKEYTANEFRKEYIAKYFKNAFRKVSITKFERVLSQIDQESSDIRLYLLIFEKNVVGGCFVFKTTGNTNEVWSPSHLVVNEAHRSYSLIFINIIFSKFRKKILEISPSRKMQKILSAMRFKEISTGSLVAPLLTKSIIHKFFKPDFLFDVNDEPYPPSQINFVPRKDVIWLKYKRAGLYYDIGLKWSERYRIPFLILIYAPMKIYDKKFVRELIYYSSSICWSFVLIPNLGLRLGNLGVAVDSLHIWSNVQEEQINFSLVGSEITEIF